MCLPLIQVRLSVTSYSPRSCHFGRPSPALPEKPVYPEIVNAGMLAMLGSWVCSRPLTPACCCTRLTPCPWKYAVDRYSPYMRLNRTSCTSDDPMFDVSDMARL